MRRRIRKYSPDRNGELKVSLNTDEVIQITLVPPNVEFMTMEGYMVNAQSYKKKIMEVRQKDNSVTIFPFSTRTEFDEFLEQKYEHIERITIYGHWQMWDGVRDMEVKEGIDAFNILENLPPAFTKDYLYGLGFARSFMSIVHVIEEISDCTEIVITDEHNTGPDITGDYFYISWNDFESIRLSTNSVGSLLQTATRSVRRAETHNVLTKNMDIDPIVPSIGRKRIRREFVEMAQGKRTISVEEQDMFLTIVSDNASELIKHSPTKVAKVKSEFELLTIRDLVKKYENSIDQNYDEKYWHKFFKMNQFILSMTFGYPVTLVQNQAHVGGQTVQGDQGKIVDFLMQNDLTRNAAIVEIKRPDTQVVASSPKGRNVYTPSAALYQAVSQVLDYRYELAKNFSNVRCNDGSVDFESYSIRCCVVAGKMPIGSNQKKSFELFRSNLNNVDIITYDELLEKIRMLSEFFEKNMDN